VHRYTAAERREITEHVYRQDHDHVVIYRSLRERGLI